MPRTTVGEGWVWKQLTGHPELLEKGCCLECVILTTIRDQSNWSKLQNVYLLFLALFWKGQRGGGQCDLALFWKGGGGGVLGGWREGGAV